MTVKRVFMVRHGETDYNAAHRWQGHLDVPLNATGRQQAQALANYLNTIPLDAIYTSDLRRAYETAQILAQPKALKVLPERRLREVDVGIFEGRTRAEISETYPMVLERWYADDNFVVPGGESRRMMQARAHDAWKAITTRRDLTSVLLVSHGGTIRMLLLKLLPAEQTLEMHFPNSSLTILTRRPGGKVYAESIGTTPHLYGD